MLLNREVLEGLDRAVHLQAAHSRDLSAVQDVEGLDQGDQVVKAILDRDDQVEHRYHRMEERCNR